MFKFNNNIIIGFNYQHFNIYFKPDKIKVTKNFKLQEVSYEEALKNYPFKEWVMFPTEETLLEFFPKSFKKQEYIGNYHYMEKTFEFNMKNDFPCYRDTQNPVNIIQYSSYSFDKNLPNIIGFLLQILGAIERGDIYDSTNI